MRPNVRDAVAEWVAHAAASGYSPETVKARRAGLQPLVDLYGKQTVASLTHRHLDTLFAGRQWKPATRNARLGQLKTFFSWCRARGYMPLHCDPAFGWRYVKEGPAKQLRIPYEEWPALFDACHTPIERMVLASGLYLFLRSSEHKFLRIKDIDLDAQEMQVYRPKTDDRDVMPISTELDAELRRYLSWYSSEVQLKPDFFLIPSRHHAKNPEGGFGYIKGSGELNPNKPIAHIFDVVKSVLGRAGYETYWQGGHTLRRSGARAYFDALAESGYSGALRRVQTMLGHKKSETTEIYLGLDLDRYKRNQALRGKPMFVQRRTVQDAKIVPIRREK